MKTIKISSLVLGLIVLGAVGYYLWNNLLGGVTPSATETAASSTPLTATEGVASTATQIGAGEFLSYFMQTDKIKAVKTSGEVVDILNNKEIVVSSAKIPNLIGAEFSYDGKKILAKLAVGKDIAFSIFDSTSSVWMGVSQPKMISAAWAPESHDVAYLEKVNNVINIGILKTDENTNPQKPELGMKRATLNSLSGEDLQVYWLNKNEILINQNPSKLVAGYILKYKIKENSFETVAVNELGVVANWDNAGAYGLKLNFSEGKNHLYLINSIGIAQKEMNFATMPEKCTLAYPFLYCGVINNMANGLPDAYFMHTGSAADDLYRINLKDNSISFLGGGGTVNLDAANLTVADDNLFFLNNYDHHLYKIDLSKIK